MVDYNVTVFKLRYTFNGSEEQEFVYRMDLVDRLEQLCSQPYGVEVQVSAEE